MTRDEGLNLRLNFWQVTTFVHDNQLIILVYGSTIYRAVSQLTIKVICRAIIGSVTVATATVTAQLNAVVHYDSILIQRQRRGPAQLGGSVGHDNKRLYTGTT